MSVEDYIEFLNNQKSFTGVQIDPKGLKGVGYEEVIEGITQATQALFDVLNTFNIGNAEKERIQSIKFTDGNENVISPMQLLTALQSSELVHNQRYQGLLGEVSSKLIGIPLTKEDFEYAVQDGVGFQLLLGVSATPWHTDYDIVRKIFHGNILYGYRYGTNGDNGDIEVRYDHMVRNAIQMGDLAPVLEYHILDEGSVDGLQGGLNPEILTPLIERLSKDDLRKYLSLIKVIFTNSIDNANMIDQKFNLHLGKYGYIGKALHSDVPQKNRKSILDSLADQSINSVTAINIFNEGLDFPEIEMIIMVSSTMSPRVYLQRLGRALRISHGKEGIIVIDFGGNYILGEELLEIVDIAKGLFPQIEFYGEHKTRGTKQSHGDIRLDTKVEELFKAEVERQKSRAVFITNITAAEKNIVTYLNAIGSNQKELSLDMNKNLGYVSLVILRHRLNSLQKIVEWIIEHRASQLKKEDFNLDSAAFETRLQEVGLARLAVPVTHLETNIVTYLNAIGSSQKKLSLDMNKRENYVHRAIWRHSLGTLQKIVEFIVGKKTMSLQASDFNLPPEEFKKRLKELGY